MTSQILRTVFVAGCAIAALSVAACANLGSYVGNSSIDAGLLAVNNDGLKLQADKNAHAAPAVLALDAEKLVTDAAALDTAIKAASGAS